MDAPPAAAPILELEKVWKCYRRRQPAASIKEAVVRGLRRRSEPGEAFWAASDISLAVQPGEVVGFCGANGAGKSSLLRMVARIDQPTWGRITVRGKVVPLLDLTTGFHPLLSGRENIALNGAIMGFSREEFEANRQAIIDFAELDDFIDSPVQTYSAGMYMRLGFAIASHVQADILLIDEVLAVGDAKFQQKCSDWFAQLKQRGVTVLLVSHDLNSLATLCDRVLWIDHGRIRAEGPPAEVLCQYWPDYTPPAAAEMQAAPGEEF